MTKQLTFQFWIFVKKNQILPKINNVKNNLIKSMDKL